LTSCLAGTEGPPERRRRIRPRDRRRLLRARRWGRPRARRWRQDILIGSAGDDWLDGGTGRSDTAWFIDAPRGVRASLRTGRARGGGRDSLSRLEGLVGSFHNDLLIGRLGKSLLAGTLGDDRLDAGRGFGIADYSLSDRGVTVDLAAGVATGEGQDTLIGIRGAIGSDRRDFLRGDETRNILIGGPSADQLEGRDGNDFLDGSEGNDTVDGGGGDDVCRRGETLAQCEATSGPSPLPTLGRQAGESPIERLQAFRSTPSLRHVLALLHANGFVRAR
jgi:hypothetical protein